MHCCEMNVYLENQNCSAKLSKNPDKRKLISLTAAALPFSCKTKREHSGQHDHFMTHNKFQILYKFGLKKVDFLTPFL